MGSDSMRESEECSIGLIGQGVVYQNVKRHIESTYQIIPLAKQSTLQQEENTGPGDVCKL